MSADLPQSGQERLRAKIERLVGTAILKNDKNYTNDIMQAVTAEIGAEALKQLDEHAAATSGVLDPEECMMLLAEDYLKRRRAIRNHFGIGEEK